MKPIPKLIFIWVCLLGCTNKHSSSLFLSANMIKVNSIIAGHSFDTSFYIFNKGDDSLLLINHTCSCECTVTNLKPNEKLPPGDSLLVSLKISTSISDLNKKKVVLCTFRSNSPEIFNRLEIKYKPK